MGPQIKSGIQIKPFENIHIYPLICELLNIELYKGSDDSPDGDLQVLKDIMKNER